MLLRKLKALLPYETKNALKRNFSYLCPAFERCFVLNELGLKKYYNKKDDSLHLGKSVLPMKIICNAKEMGAFNSEFADIVYPMLPDKKGINTLPYLEGPYELGKVRIDNGDIVFDCGANIGLFSIMATLSKDCKCYAFEPLPSNISCLNEIVKFNPNITLSPYAICDRDGIIQFSNSEDISVETKIVLRKSKKDTITVNCTTLDSFVDKNKISHVDFIKADIEGAERYLLKGAKHVLKEFAPKISVCTYHLPDDSKVLRELIIDANPKYIVKEKYKKMYAYVPK